MQVKKFRFNLKFDLIAYFNSELFENENKV